MADSEFQRPTLAENISMLRTDLFSRLDASDTIRRMDEDVRAKVYAAALHTVYGYIDYLALNMLPDKCDEAWLERHAAMKRCPRKSPTASAGFMRWDGVTNGITVKAGAVIYLVTPVNGLPSSGVADSVAGGFDIEDLETWRARVLERYYWTPLGGGDGDYIVWAKEVPGITRAWTYRHWMGAGTVGVMVASDDPVNPIPDAATVAAVKAHIAPLAPVAGADLYPFAPVARKVDFRIRLTPDTPEVRSAVTAELRSFLLRDGYPEGVLELSRVNEAISIAAGEHSHVLVAPTASISIAKNELAILGALAWT